MHRFKRYGMVISGAAAGAVNGLLGAGGGMLLVPLLTLLTDTEESAIFPTSISIILPICIVSLAVAPWESSVDAANILPYLTGSAAGGLLAGLFGSRIPTKWLHRGLGILILWGGLRYLC